MSSYGIGSTVRISTAIRNEAGELVDPAGISLALRLPDGTVSPAFGQSSTPPVVRDSLGVFRLDYPTEQAGPHIARWSVAGPDTTEEQPFEVEPIWGETGIISLKDAKVHLKKKLTDTTDDEKLQGYILAATDMIHDRMGQVAPVEITEGYHAPHRNVIVLNTRPVISVVSVTRSGVALAAQDGPAGVRGWYLDGTEGVLRNSAGWSGYSLVTYRAGRVPTPFRFRLAAKELVAHLWRTGQTNSDGGRPPLQGDVQASPGDFALPYNVRQLLGLNKAQRDIPSIG